MSAPPLDKMVHTPKRGETAPIKPERARLGGNNVNTR